MRSLKAIRRHRVEKVRAGPLNGIFHRDSGRVAFISHPLWPSEPEHYTALQAEARSDAEAKFGAQAASFDAFTFGRLPNRVFTWLSGGTP